MTTERERDAIELLDRIYGRKADHDLLDAGMVENWIDEQIAAFIRKHGSFAEQLRTLTEEDRYTFFGGRRGEKHERMLLALMDGITEGKEVHVAAPTREQAEAIYAEAKARIEAESDERNASGG